MPFIKLRSSDSEIFPVDLEIAKQSVTIMTMLQELGMDEVVGLGIIFSYLSVLTVLFEFILDVSFCYIGSFFCVCLADQVSLLEKALDKVDN